MTWLPKALPRKYDLLMFRTSNPEYLVESQQTPFGGDGGLGCTGPQKLAQQVVALLLAGDLPHLFEPRGGSFVDELLRSNANTGADVDLAFQTTRPDIIDELRNLNPFYASLPADEQLSDLELLNSVIRSGSVELTIQITTAAGTAFSFVAPIDTNRLLSEADL